MERCLSSSHPPCVYYTMEGCTSGECQTWDYISRIPKQQLVSTPNLLAVPELCEGFPVHC
ncbi:hypothetical protein DAPPUDRAFT_259755 [Daphnia pulex]|uniref:Uncharacterized protein n=1 Tax=Daphnia pulex TaxID=6669 RepID=E9HHT2_DAPPU|nr:hypothetical protein DAPPUDRAFT_259755 [Daphnia pulex]|eukprot:EFX68714.1 hypothetical protein DAPPUDRAFT_259755 [Daphnia pulex]